MLQKPKNFTMIDEGFTCAVCGKVVEPLNYSARDHCPYCLCSLHVDVNPGDRLAECHGILKPIDIEKYKSLAKTIVEKIYNANIANILTISNKLSF